jgi:hypothetical protein
MKIRWTRIAESGRGYGEDVLTLDGVEKIPEPMIRPMLSED